MSDPPTRVSGAAHASPVEEGQTSVASLQMSDRVAIRFQCAPGVDGAVMRATRPIPWRLRVSATEDLSYGLQAPVVLEFHRDSGTIAAGAEIEIQVSRSAIDFSYHNDVILTVQWEEGIETAYRLFWIRVESSVAEEFSAQNRLASLGYYTGHLRELPEQEFGMDHPQKDQAILHFQADHGIEPDAQLTAVMRDKLREVTGDPAGGGRR